MVVRDLGTVNFARLLTAAVFADSRKREASCAPCTGKSGVAERGLLVVVAQFLITAAFEAPGNGEEFRIARDFSGVTERHEVLPAGLLPSGATCAAPGERIARCS